MIDAQRIVINGIRATIRPDELKASSIAEWKTALKGLLGQGVQEFVFDLSDISFMDSSGIGLLIQTYNSLLKTKGTLTVVNASKDLHKFFCTMCLEKVLDISQR